MGVCMTVPRGIAMEMIDHEAGVETFNSPPVPCFILTCVSIVHYYGFRTKIYNINLVDLIVSLIYFYSEFI